MNAINLAEVRKAAEVTASKFKDVLNYPKECYGRKQLAYAVSKPNKDTELQAGNLSRETLLFKWI